MAKLSQVLRDERLAFDVENVCFWRPVWYEALSAVQAGQRLPDALMSMPEGIAKRMQAALAPQAEDDDVEVTGEKTWEERDRELRAAAVVLE